MKMAETNIVKPPHHVDAALGKYLDAAPALVPTQIKSMPKFFHSEHKLA
jgi:hypothetical protein